MRLELPISIVRPMGIERPMAIERFTIIEGPKGIVRTIVINVVNGKRTTKVNQILLFINGFINISKNIYFIYSPVFTLAFKKIKVPDIL